jgi:hypothetical protein
MTHTRQYDDTEGDFSGWSPVPEKCRNAACGSELYVRMRLWESSHNDHLIGKTDE